MATQWRPALLVSGLLLLALAPCAAGLRLEPHGGADLLSAINELKSHRWPWEGDICLTIDGPFMGRLSNTVSMMNTVLDVAISTGVHFLFPHYYTRFMEQEGFSELFGREPTCLQHAARRYRPTCADDEDECCDRVGRCLMKNLRVDTTAGDSIFSTSCYCSQIVTVNSSDLAWDHDYKQTHSILRRRYWQGPLGLQELRESRELQRPQVAVHMRLGDIEHNCSARFNTYNCNKRLKAELYCQTLSALLTVLPASCVDVNLYTDGTPRSPDVTFVTGCLRNAGVEARVLAPSSLSTQRSFNSLVRADVLIFGSSGFGQVAAVLARPTTARVGAPMPTNYPTEPLGFLPNTTQLSLSEGSDNISIAEAASKIGQNEAIQALVARCRALPAQLSEPLVQFEESVEIDAGEERDVFES